MNDEAQFIPSPTQDTITIAITVFQRTEFICQAITSALDQTLPVRVIVVEDCAPTDAVAILVQRTFGNRVTYIRNPARRGLFGNWNACMEYVETPWISILHDDDFLRPDFVEKMVSLAKVAPSSAIYFCRCEVADESGTVLPCSDHGFYDFPPPWRVLNIENFARFNQVLFPGQLFHIASARAVGGFRNGSLFAGDWEMWFRLAFHFGAAQTHASVAVCRNHSDAGRGTNRIVRIGRKRALDIVQTRRNFALLRTRQPDALVSRRELLRASPISIKEMLDFMGGFSPRIVRYHLGLLHESTAPNFRYALLQKLVSIGGVPFLRMVAWIRKQLHR